MPALRVLTPTRRARILLWAPSLYEGGFKQHHVDGEALALHAHLRARGHHVCLLDAYNRAANASPLADVLAGGGFDVLIVHLWTSDAYGPRLAEIADELAAARFRHAVAVLGFGPLATSAAAELRAHGAVDHVVGLHPNSGPARDPLVAAVAADAADALRGHTSLLDLTAEDVARQPEAVVSVSASRGCRSRCTFCAYNADLGAGWTELPIAAAVADIAHLHELTGATRFSMDDVDFGGTRDACIRRAGQLRDALHAHGLAGRVGLSMNIRSETLTGEAITLLAEAGVDVLLIGVESLNPDTLHRLYGKRQDLDHLRRVVAAADAAGITTVASYILWHPWQTLPALRAELAALEEFGRHRVPQFLARSRLLVIPGTVAERRIRDDGLLDAAPFHRGFRFADPEIADLDAQLSDWYAQHVRPVLAGLHESRAGDLTRLAELKFAEWQWFTDLLDIPTRQPAGAIS
ncbi:hypothetical protein GCM10010124_31240 [Pilimelia terevasa]|uniref:Elp3/MiaA/NifB-like radical SAM core domain-containing protein n=1 Tax=Pilimelia terevasa TaxID=53372 RepID=A0A8J3BQM4_9ACTN|nr:radical SAM protein [Pilimelia terevasa]GGK36369.1 hypothetical protein GCM10010124_31240 [Pilimelia terevasa]